MSTIDTIISLARQGEQNALEFAWAVAEFFPSWWADIGGDPLLADTREAHGAYISFLHSQLAPEGIAHATVRDRFAFGRYWTRKRVEALAAFLGWMPTYHQIRALTTHGDEVERRLKILVDWMSVNERIPTVEEMHAMFDRDGRDARARALLALRRALNRALVLDALPARLREAARDFLAAIAAVGGQDGV